MTTTRDKLGALSGASNATTAVITWAANPAAGAKVLVAVCYNAGTNKVSSVKDNGTTQSKFTLDANYNNTSIGATISVYRADGISLPSSGSYKVTVTFSSALYATTAGYSYLGANTGAPTATNHSTGTSNSAVTGTATPSKAGALYFATETDNTGTSETITLTGSGFTEEATENTTTLYNLSRWLTRSTPAARRPRSAPGP